MYLCVCVWGVCVCVCEVCVFVCLGCVCGVCGVCALCTVRLMLPKKHFACRADEVFLCGHVSDE